MKKDKPTAILVAVIILSPILFGYIAGFSMYKEYKKRVAYLEENAQNKFTELEGSIKEFYVKLENNIHKEKIARDDVLHVVKAIQDDIEQWKHDYKTAISELKSEIDSLKIDRLARMVDKLESDIDSFKITIQDMDLKLDEARSGSRTSTAKETKEDAVNINLGKISVER